MFGSWQVSRTSNFTYLQFDTGAWYENTGLCFYITLFGVEIADSP